MNETIAVFDLATVDLVEMYSADPQRAMDHAIFILSNPDVATTRIRYLSKLRAGSVNIDPEDYSHELETLRNTDLTEVVTAGQIPFLKIIKICADPTVLARAFDASLEHFEKEYERRKGEKPAAPAEFASILAMVQAGNWTSEAASVMAALQWNIADGHLGIRPINLVWNASLAAAGTSSNMSRPVEKICEVKNGAVFIKADEAEIPFGLCRLFFSEPNRHRVTTWLPKLDLVNGKWVNSGIALSEILGHAPQQPVEIKWFQVANDESRDWFDTTEVREFVDKLISGSRQRESADRFLKPDSTSSQ